MFRTPIRTGPAARCTARWLALTVATSLLMPAAVGAQIPAASKDPGRQGIVDPSTIPATFPFRHVAGEVVVDATIGTAGPLPMMLDTGAPLNIPAELIASQGFPIVGQQPTNSAGGVQTTQDIAAVPSLAVGPVKIGSTAAISGWVGQDNPLSCVTQTGLVGANAMADAVWQIDYQAQTVTVAPSVDVLGHIDGAISVPFIPGQGLAPNPFIGFDIGTGSLAFLVDTGSDAGIVIGPKELAATGIAVPADAPTVTAQASGAQGVFDVELKYVDLPMKLGDTAVTLPVAVGDVVAGFGNIGNAFLSQFVVTFDWSTRTLYLDPVSADGSFGTPAPTAGSIGWNGTNVVVTKVAKGSPAEQAGMKLGDIVSSVDGTAVSTRDDFCAAFTGPRPTTIQTADGTTYDLSPFEGFFAKP
jgi:hypothetical protein